MMSNESLDYAGEGMYREHIMDYYSNPRNKGVIENPDIKFHDTNPLCGDVIDWFINLENNNLVEIKFTGKGCAISQAASSMLSETIQGKEMNKILKIKNQEMFDLLGIELSAMRIKCALLGLKAIQKAIIQYQAGVRNE